MMEALNNVAAGIKTCCYDKPLEHKKTTSLLVGSLALAGLAYYTGNLNSAGFNKLSGAAASVINGAVEFAQANKAATGVVGAAVTAAVVYAVYKCCGESVEQARERLNNDFKNARKNLDHLKRATSSEKSLDELKAEAEAKKGPAEAEDATEAAKQEYEAATKAVKEQEASEKALEKANKAFCDAQVALEAFNIANPPKISE